MNTMSVSNYFILVLVISSITFWSLSLSDHRNMRSIPKGLKLGVATSAYQVEGAWNAADKSPSIWDEFTHTPGALEDGSTGDHICKSYEFYKRDLQMLKFLGVDFYRFSISWPRVLPNGFSNVISKDGIQYYNNLINGLIANGIEPVVTIFHWDLPQNLQDIGGWTNPLIADWFEDYARVLYDTFGDRVKTWITINEPKQVAIVGYGTTFFAPNVLSPGIGDYMAAKNVLLAHARAWHLYNKEYREIQKGICGITIATDFREGATNSTSDMEAGRLALDFEVGLYSHPIFSTTGGFPEGVIKRVAEKSAQQGFSTSRLPELTQVEINYIKGTSDFYGFNHYSTQFYTETGYKPGLYPIPSYKDDVGAVFSFLDHKTAPVIHSTSIPGGMRKALNWVREQYNNPLILITENGYGTFGGLNDTDRIQYHIDYLGAMLDAIGDGCNITMYTTWTLMDNFEWDLGIKAKFGLFEVDFNDENRKRTARSSVFWFRNLTSTRHVDSSYEVEHKELTF